MRYPIQVRFFLLERQCKKYWSLLIALFPVKSMFSQMMRKKRLYLTSYMKRISANFKMQNEMESWDQRLRLSFVQKTKEKNIQILADDDVQYLVIGNGEQQQFKKGSKETFDFDELSRLVSAVLGNEEDPDYSGRVELTDSGFKANVNKGNAAFAQGILDGAIGQAEVEEGENITYNIMFTIGDISYGISSDTGYFFKQEAGEKIYAQLEEQLLRTVKTRIGVRNAAS